MKRRALLLVNRGSRSGETSHQEAVRRLRDLGFELVEGAPNTRIGDAIRTHASNVDLIIVGGGDGSVNAAAEELVKARKPLGILPLGTANDLARTLNLPTDLAAACEVIAEGHTRRIDLGRVNGKPFLNVASIGLSVAVTRRLTKSSKGWLGVFAYLVAALRAVVATRPFHTTIRCDGELHTAYTMQVAVGNGRHYGGGMTIAKDAEPDDGWLDLYSLEVSHWLGLLPLLPALWRGTLERKSQARVLRGKAVEIQTRRPRTVTADGEVVTKTPVTFTVEPTAIEVFIRREDPGQK